MFRKSLEPNAVLGIKLGDRERIKKKSEVNRQKREGDARLL